MDANRVTELESKFDQGTLTFDEYIELSVEHYGDTKEDAERMYVGYLAKHTPNYGNGILF
ncbi:hypothetical protein [Hymenobacter metallicola]|uniref:Uncharacterized protein n=1 Tax=Hymenobacter metallicola TaxID=2563114 RepID=A0A4Z0Q0G5_9BACT|nr:hypothetical protein [Hymenobacter metallicola]TGE23520.1 hypothetical protein E5K02_20250 [Hymenobacter metallicola]